MTDQLDNETDKSDRGILNLRNLVAAVSEAFRLHYRLLVLLMAISFSGALLFVAISKQSYTATAVLGPTVTLADTTGASSLQNIARRVGGGLLGSAGLNETFNEFTALLTSNRLAGALAQNPAVMHEVFNTQWDDRNKRWRERNGVLDGAIDTVKRLIGRPIKAVPDQDDLLQFLAARMTVNAALDTGYDTVSLTFSGRDETTNLLTLILRTADDIIREDRRRDVAARIAYLREALLNLTVASEKDILIQTLSEQDQKMMIIASDHRYASTYIDPPYTPIRPSNPNPYQDLFIAMFLTVGAWFGLVSLARQRGRVHRYLEWLAGRRGRRETAARTSVRHDTQMDPKRMAP